MTLDSNLPVESQAQSEKRKKPKRLLNHMADLADGFDQFDMIPRKLSRAYIDNEFPEAKFRLLLAIMSHSSDFHVKRSYLENRFSHKSLVKYLKELEVEGYIYPQTFPCPTGGVMKIYNVRSLEHWLIYRQSDEPSLGRGSVGRGSLSRGHKDPKGKEKQESKIKTPAQFSEPSVPETPEVESARKPSASRGGLKEVVSKSVLEGMLKGLFETTVGRDVIRALLHDMLKACPNREDLLEVIKEQEKTQSGLLIWTIRNRQALIHRAGIKVARE